MITVLIYVYLSFFFAVTDNIEQVVASEKKRVFLQMSHLI
jgi:hypothetical protein